jgi:hypothetical protein
MNIQGRQSQLTTFVRWAPLVSLTFGMITRSASSSSDSLAVYPTRTVPYSKKQSHRKLRTDFRPIRRSRRQVLLHIDYLTQYRSQVAENTVVLNVDSDVTFVSPRIPEKPTSGAPALHPEHVTLVTTRQSQRTWESSTGL